MPYWEGAGRSGTDNTPVVSAVPAGVFQWALAARDVTTEDAAPIICWLTLAAPRLAHKGQHEKQLGLGTA